MAKTTLLKRGSRGAAVRNLQLLLAITADGIFGPDTEKAVVAAQKRLGLVVDGKAGPQTHKALKAEAAPVKPGRAEPDKSAINEGNPQPGKRLDKVTAYPPANDDSLILLDTARPISEIIFHCTATPEGKDFTVADIRAWHKKRGWSDIGYHYVVYRDGRIMVGRPVGQVGAHVANRNTGTIGVAYIGGLTADTKTAKDTRTDAQRRSMLYLRNALMARHEGIRKLSGHNEYAAKACPCFSVPNDDLGDIAA